MRTAHSWSAVALAVIVSAAVARPGVAADPPATSPAATRNPLFTVAGGQFQDRRGGPSVGPAGDAGPVLVHARAGNWAKYAAFDFDSGVAGFRIESATQGGTASLEVHLDRPDGPLLGRIARLPKSNAPDGYLSASCKVDNGQAGVRDVYLVFGGDAAATTAVQMFVFEKSLKHRGPPPDLSVRLDRPDVADRPATTAWGVPEAGLTDDFADGRMANWNAHGFTVDHGTAVAKGDAVAFTPRAYINPTDTGGEWRTMAQAALTADLTADDAAAKPGIGFTSTDGTRSVAVVLDVAADLIRVTRRLADGPTTTVRTQPKLAADPARTFHLRPGQTYRLRVAWSPYSNALMATLSDPAGKALTTVRTVVDLPAARRPMLLNAGGPARFAHVVFDPTLDGWNPRWQWLKTPALPVSDVCNPAVWKWTDGKFYMVWRKFGADTFHGVASSDDAVHWTVVTDRVMKCTGDMNVLVDPFGDGKVYCTPGGNDMPWFASDGADRFAHWEPTGKRLGNIHGFNRIQEIIDTAKHPQMKPVELNGHRYRFVAFVEDWTHAPKPHTGVMLSDTLTDWTVADPAPVLPPRDDFWGEKGSAIGSAVVLPDGDVLLASCSCTAEGYTGAAEPSNVSVVVDGRRPWVIKRLATLPDAPVSREEVWYQGPNFGTAFVYDPATDTLYYYGGFHDYSIGVMRAVGFLHGQPPAAAGR